MIKDRALHLTIPLRALPLFAAALVVLALLVHPQAGYSQATTIQYFPETGHTVKGRFLQYWNEHGGLAQQGYPLTQEFQEKNALDGKTYTVQYFERAVFEMHPENQPPYDVLLSQLGKFQLDGRYPNGSNPAAGQAIKIFDPPGQNPFYVLQDRTSDKEQLGGFQPAAGHKYALVFAQVFNISTASPTTHFDADAIQMRDNQGRKYPLADDKVQREAADENPLGNGGSTGIYSTDVAGGDTMEEVFVFEVPNDAGGYHLIVGQ